MLHVHLERKPEAKAMMNDAKDLGLKEKLTLPSSLTVSSRFSGLRIGWGSGSSLSVA